MASGSVQFTLWGAYGEQLGTYAGASSVCCYPLEMSVYFGGKPIWQGEPSYGGNYGSGTLLQGFVYLDRLGTNINLSGTSFSSFYPYGDPSGVGLDKLEFATYTRDSYTGFDYAVNRMYNSQGGRFNTPDPQYAGALKNPQSLNHYSYVLGDPVNANDPTGLCSVIGSGITQSAYSDPTSAQQEFANEIGGISVTPYSNGTILGGVASVTVQGLGVPTSATFDWFNALNLAAETPGPISVYAFSGSGGAFTTAYNWLSSAIQARITSITYIDPGNFATPLASGMPGTTVTYYTDNADLANLAVQIFGVLPEGTINFVNTGSCGHNENCAINAFAGQLSQTATSCTVGAGSVIGLPPRVPAYGLSALLFYAFGDVPDPVPSVTETIRYDVP
jgi:RHS repeat-associated protein